MNFIQISLVAEPLHDDDKKSPGFSDESDSEDVHLISTRRRRVKKALKVLGHTTQEFERRKALAVLGLTEKQWQEGNRYFPLARSRTHQDMPPHSPRTPTSPPGHHRRNTMPVPLTHAKAVRILGMDDAQLRRLKAVHVLGVPDFDVDVTESRALALIGTTPS